jgi:hypothetical protein
MNEVTSFSGSSGRADDVKKCADFGWNIPNIRKMLELLFLEMWEIFPFQEYFGGIFFPFSLFSFLFFLIPLFFFTPLGSLRSE